MSSHYYNSLKYVVGIFKPSPKADSVWQLSPFYFAIKLNCPIRLPQCTADVFNVEVAQPPQAAE